MFERVISLGWWCGPAIELKRIGYRDSSYPFDWLLSHDFEKLVQLISDKEVMYFLNEEMFQYKDRPDKWFNSRYQVSIFNDFDKYILLKNQLDEVNKKYQRRMIRFYRTLQKPTLLVRYVKNKEECIYIQKNLKKIETVFQKYNENNKVIYIIEDKMKEYFESDRKEFYFIDSRLEESPIYFFLDKSETLKEYIIKNTKKPELQKKKNKQIKNQHLINISNFLKQEAINDNKIHEEGKLEHLDKEFPILYYFKEDCNGCGACVMICPKEAIDYIRIDDFNYPRINIEKCINCRLCQKVCPLKTVV